MIATQKKDKKRDGSNNSSVEDNDDMDPNYKDVGNQGDDSTDKEEMDNNGNT